MRPVALRKVLLLIHAECRKNPDILRGSCFYLSGAAGNVYPAPDANISVDEAVLIGLCCGFYDKLSNDAADNGVTQSKCTESVLPSLTLPEICETRGLF